MDIVIGVDWVNEVVVVRKEAAEWAAVEESLIGDRVIAVSDLQVMQLIRFRPCKLQRLPSRNT